MHGLGPFRTVTVLDVCPRPGLVCCSAFLTASLSTLRRALAASWLHVCGVCLLSVHVKHTRFLALALLLCSICMYIDSHM